MTHPHIMTLLNGTKETSCSYILFPFKGKTRYTLDDYISLSERGYTRHCATHKEIDDWYYDVTAYDLKTNQRFRIVINAFAVYAHGIDLLGNRYTITIDEMPNKMYKMIIDLIHLGWIEVQPQFPKNHPVLLEKATVTVETLAGTMKHQLFTQ